MLYLMAFGTKTNLASQSAFTKGFRESSRNDSRNDFNDHPSRSAMAASPAEKSPGIFVVKGPVRQY